MAARRSAKLGASPRAGTLHTPPLVAVHRICMVRSTSQGRSSKVFGVHSLRGVAKKPLP